MANIRQLIAELFLRDRTEEGATSARRNLEGVATSAEGAVKAVETTERATVNAERAYARLQRRIEPLQAAQERLARDERTLAAARDIGRIGNEKYEASLQRLHAEYARTEERIVRQEQSLRRAAKAQTDSASAARENARGMEEIAQANERVEKSNAGLIGSTAQLGANLAAAAAAFFGLQRAKIESIDGATKLGVALSILGRVLPIAGVAALALGLFKLGEATVNAVGRIVESSTALAKVQREADAQAASAIESTGGAARRSLEDIKALATGIQNVTNFADEKLVRAGAQLLTFTSVAREQYDRALTISADIAARLNRDVEQVTLQIGKALNDPVRNLSALSESGIQFSDTQRREIVGNVKSGNIDKAQIVILEELERQFAGAAAAAREAEGGTLALANAWGDLKERLGDRIVDKTTESTNRLARAVSDPAFQEFFEFLGDVAGGFEAFGKNVQATFLEIGAGILRTIQGAGAAFRREVAAIKSINEIDQLEVLRDDLDARIPAAIRRNRRVGSAREQIDVNSLRSRRDDADNRIAYLKSLTLTVNDLRETVGLAAVDLSQLEAGSPDAIVDAQARLDIVRRELEAARRGRPALQEARAAAALDEAVEKSGLIGPAADEFRALQAEIQATTREVEKLEAAFDVDLLGPIEDAVARLEQLRDAADGGPVDLAAAERRLDIEAKIADLRRQADAKGLALDEARARAQLERQGLLEAELALQERLAQIEARVFAAAEEADIAGLGGREYDLAQDRLDIEREIRDLRVEAAAAGIEFNEEAARAALEEEKALRRLADERKAFSDDLTRVADDFIDRFARGDRDAFRAFARDLKNILFDTVLDPFKQAFASLLQNVFSGGGGGFSIFTPGINGGNPAASTAAALGGAGRLNAAGGIGASGIAGLGSAGAALGSLALPAALTFGLTQEGTTGRVARGVGTALGVGGGALGVGIAAGLAAGPAGWIALGVGALAGALAGLFGNGPSDNPTGGAVNFSTFAAQDQFAKNNNAENIEARDRLLDATSQLARALTTLTGGSLVGPAISIQVGSRKGTRIISAAGGDVTTPVGDAEAAEREIVRQLTASLTGGNEVLTRVARELGAAGKSIDDIVGRLSALDQVLNVDDRIVDEFETALDRVRDAFNGLDISTGALKDAFDDAVDALGARLDREESRAALAADNALAAQIADLLEAREARQRAAEEIAGAGGNVDFTLLARNTERAVLALFNLDQRLGQAIDPARFQVDEFRRNQIREIEALTAAIERGAFADPAAVLDKLLRTQAAERVQFVRSLSDEDKLRLSGELGSFDDLGGRYAEALTRVNENVEDRLNDLDRVLAEAEARIADATRRFEDAERALFTINDRYFEGSPAAQLDQLRANAEDLTARALAGDTLARDQATSVITDFIERSRVINASGPQFFDDLRLGKDLLTQLRDGYAAERDAAIAERDAILASRDYLREIRDALLGDGLSRETIDSLLARIPEADPLFGFLQTLAGVIDRQIDQNDRLANIIAGLSPADVGLDRGDTQSAEVLAFDAARRAASFEPPPSGGAQIVQLSPPASQGQQGSEQVVTGLFEVARAVERNTKAMQEIEESQRPFRSKMLEYQRAIAGQRSVASVSP